MSLWRQSLFLLQKEVIVEWREKYALGGILLYLTGMLFIIYFMMESAAPATWNAIFWVILLFTAVNMITRGFTAESGRSFMYYYSTVNPSAMILSKIIYHTLLLFLLSMIALVLYIGFLGNPIQNMEVFIMGVVLGDIGLALVLSFVSSIASKAGNSGTLLAILSFPLLIPILKIMSKVSEEAMYPQTGDSLFFDVSILLAFDVVLLALALLLFPYIWRD